jgi:hypothetical protein
MQALLGLIGGVLLANAAWMVVQRLSANARATGRVVGHEARSIGASDSSSPVTTLHHAVIEFRDAGGRPHRFTAVGGDVRRHPPPGTTVDVRFPPGDPSSATVAGFANTWAMPVVWALAGALAVWAAVFR